MKARRSETSLLCARRHTHVWCVPVERSVTGLFQHRFGRAAGHITGFLRLAAVLHLGNWSQLKTVQKKLCLASFTNLYTQYLGIRPYRSQLPYQALLDSERKQWQMSSMKYKDLAAIFKKRLDNIHLTSLVRAEQEMITRGDYGYFEEDNCVYRFLKTAGEGSLELLFSPEDVGLHRSLVQRIRVSSQQTFLAVALKDFDHEDSKCYVVNLESTPELVHIISNIFSFEWVNDHVLFHSRLENLQCRSVYMTDIRNRRTTKLVYMEQDPRFFVDLYLTRDRHFLTINSNSKTTSEVWLVDCNCPFQSPVLVQQRVPGAIYHVEHSNGHLYILTTHGEPAEYKLMKASVNSSIKQWKPIYQVKPHSRLVDMEIIKDHCVMFVKRHNELHMDVTSLSSEMLCHSMKLPAWACAVQLAVHPEQSTDLLQFDLESPVCRPVTFAYSVLENTLAIEADHAIGNNGTCQVIHLKAKSKDGTLVPITLFCEADDGLTQRPLLVHVYGAYGMDLNMNFKAENKLLVEDGWILAYCHVRGGGELGCSWHKQGILDRKSNGVHDLQACIKHIHQLGYSQPCYTAIMAASAGGVVVGALANSDPGLFQAMILEAPFLDVLNTMVDTSLPLTTEEEEEWGSPACNMEDYRSIESYCPYQNIRPQSYPSVLITAYENDQRVLLSGLLSYVKKLRMAAEHNLQSSDLTDSRTPKILLDVHPGGSHCDSLPWEESLQKVAMHLSFLHEELNLNESNLSFQR
ncbi:PREDICTED: prolyl endopeptidase-like [Nanorana parkeri]|uniref:prolyl endopeptidase-like n=1 Tax=Nanorana parkeri TaxID=125878 RepID=UPI000854DD98|nr:PREDICTED: prolyl endopeptidase-like [Nanorana parkeri]